MGKKQHSKDKMYISPTEWKSEWGGKALEIEKKPLRKLPFDCCSISFQPFSNPVCSPDGMIFDLVNIMPYFKKNGNKNPVTGAPLAAKDLIKLNFTKNTDNKYICPVTYKVLTPNSHIVAIRNTGNVFSWDAIEELNIRPKYWMDLLSGDPFTRADIITLQDPHRASRSIDDFVHVKEAPVNTSNETPAAQVVSSNPSLTRLLAKLPGAPAGGAGAGAGAGTNESKDESKGKPEAKKESAKKAADKPAAAAGGEVKITVDSLKRKADGLPEDGPGEPKRYKAAYSHSKMSAAFTSTALSVVTQNERADLTDEEVRELWYTQIRKRGKGKKAYLRIVTSLGNLSILLHFDIVPRTTHNFISLCQKKYYNGVKFHRLIAGFMVQGGDPTGTGTGGESAWGKPFRDEFAATLRHDARGVIAMANSGPGTNGSQFYITFKPTPHLDDKHTVFGKVVGGMEVLDLIEQQQCGTGEEKTSPVTDITILDTIIYTNPFDDMPYEADHEKEAKKKLEEDKQAALDADRGLWFSAPQPRDLKATGTGVGKYLQLPQAVAAASAGAAAAGEKKAKKPKKDKPTAAAEGAAAAAATAAGAGAGDGGDGGASGFASYKDAFRKAKAASGGGGGGGAPAAAAAAKPAAGGSGAGASAGGSSYGNFGAW